VRGAAASLRENVRQSHLSAWSFVKKNPVKGFERKMMYFIYYNLIIQEKRYNVKALAYGYKCTNRQILKRFPHHCGFTGLEKSMECFER